MLAFFPSGRSGSTQQGSGEQVQHLQLPTFVGRQFLPWDVRRWCGVGLRILVVLSCWSCGVATAQWVKVDPAFPGDAVPSEPVRVLEVESDGEVLIGGTMTNAAGLTRMHLARLDAAGALDDTFAPVLDGGVRRIECLAGGQVLIAGIFARVNGSLRPGLARLNEDGSLDEGFVPPNPVGGGLLTGTAGPEGAVYVTGMFTELGGVPANRLARLNSDGTVDITFQSPFAATNTLSVACVQEDGKVIVAGSFTNIAGVIANNVARLNIDGSVDASFRSGLIPHERVRRSVLQADGRLVAAVSMVAGTEMTTTPIRVVRFERDGSLDPAFRVTLDSAGLVYTSAVHDMQLQADGKILVSGTFLRVNGVPRAKLVRLESDGTVDYCFDVPLSAEWLPLTIAQDAEDGILVGGMFGGVLGTWRPNLIRLLPSAGCEPGVIGMAVNSLIVREDARRVMVPVVRAGGADQEEAVTYETRERTAQGGIDYESKSGTLVFGRGERSHAIEVVLMHEHLEPGPREFEVVLTGGPSSLGGLTNCIITVVDAPSGSAGAADKNFVVEVDGPVRVIVPLTDGGAFIAGGFTNVNGELSPGLARLSADGSKAEGFVRTMPLDGVVKSMALDGAGGVLIVGTFRHVDGVLRPGMARLGADGALDPAFHPFAAWPTNLAGAVVQMDAVCVLQDGSIICGGTVPTGDDSVRRNLFKMTGAGVLEAGFDERMPSLVVVSRLTALADGHFLVCGHGLGNSLVSIQGDGTIAPSFVSPPDLQVVSYFEDGLDVMPDGRVIIAGGISLSAQLPERPCLWRLNPDGSRDQGFVPTTEFGLMGTLINAELLSAGSDGRVLMHGTFASSAGTVQTLMSVHADGTPDWSFDSGTGFAPASPSVYVEVSALAALSGGGWLVGGDFGGYDGFTQRYLVKLLPETLERPSVFQLGHEDWVVEETNRWIRVEVWRRGDAREIGRAHV